MYKKILISGGDYEEDVLTTITIETLDNHKDSKVLASALIDLIHQAIKTSAEDIKSKINSKTLILQTQKFSTEEVWGPTEEL